MKTALAWMTGLMGLGFLDGMLGLGISEDVYVLIGFGMIAVLIWMWVIVSKTE